MYVKNLNRDFDIKLLPVFLLVSLVFQGIEGKPLKYDHSHLSDRLINDLYQKYKEAVSNNADLVILRRQFDHNRLFEIHVKKLKEVNGFKQHNLMIKGNPRNGRNPFIYINNPVESKIPNAFLTLEEFKEALTKRIERQRNELTTKQRRVVLLSVDRITKKNKGITPKESHPILTDSNDINKFINNLYSVSKKELFSRAQKSEIDGESKKKIILDSIALLFNATDTSSTLSENFVVGKESETHYESSVTNKSGGSFEVSSGLNSVSKEVLKLSSMPTQETYGKSFENTDTRISKSTKALKPIDITRTSSILEPNFKTNRQAIEPQIYFSSLSFQSSHDAVTEPNSVINSSTGQISDYSSVFDSSKETSESIPSRTTPKVAESTNRHTPQRRSTTNKHNIIKNKSVITKRPTLGRPLVFMGGR